MKRNLTFLLVLAATVILGTGKVNGQAIKVNIPITLAGTPNIGYEQTISQQFSLNADLLWTPYMFKKTESVMRIMVLNGEARYYINPKYYYTNNLYDGLYVGPYALWSQFNVGFRKSGDTDSERSFRYRGWAVSGGVSVGYKFFLSERFRLDINLGVGYAHLQYDKHRLGGYYNEQFVQRKATKMWIGPTKFGIHLVYNIFR